MSSMRAWAMWLADRLGWPGWVGLVLLAAAASVRWLWLPEVQSELDNLRAEAARLEARRAALSRMAPVAAGPVHLDKSTDLPEAVARLLRSAVRAGLVPQKGEYRLTRSGVLTRYQIQLPLRGPYPALRSFLSDSLNGTPGLALERISLSRERVEEGELKAVFHFSLYIDPEADT